MLSESDDRDFTEAEIRAVALGEAADRGWFDASLLLKGEVVVRRKDVSQEEGGVCPGL